MRNMENLEEVFISARHAKMNTNNHIREREELYQKKAIDFLNNENLFSENTKLMYGKWIGTLCEGEVYCRKVIPGENYEK